METRAAALFVMLAGCGSSGRSPSHTSSTGGQTTSGTTGSTTSGTTGGGPGTFSAMCNGQATTITGTVVAPNGADPIANAFVYVPTSRGMFPSSVSCDVCNQPVDGFSATTNSGADGTFTLDLGNVQVAAQLQLTVNKGRFRHTATVSVTPCTSNVATDTRLPGKASTAGDDIPKIAVATGVRDALDVVLVAMGLDKDLGFDCYENRASTTSALTTPCGVRLGSSPAQLTDLLKDPNKLDEYNILFISCAYGKYATLSAADQAAIKTNLSAWVGKGGRLFATDRSYDYVAQSFPNDLMFANGNTAVDAANVGVGSASNPATYSGKVNDATMADWLRVVGALQSGSTTLSLTGYLTQWSVVQSVPMTTVDEVDATNAQIQSSSMTVTGS
jgi:hypothetical protein